MEGKTNKVVIIVAITTALALIGDSMLYIVLPIYYLEAGLDSLWQVGIVLSINRFIRLPLHPFIGYFYHKVSLRSGMIIAVCLAVVSTVGYGLAKGFIIWLILRCLWGIAWSLLKIGGMSTTVYYSSDQNRGQMIGLYNGIFRIGSLVGMLLGGVIVPFIGFSQTSIIFGIISILGIPLVWMTVTSTINQDESEQKVSLTSKPRFFRSLLNKRTILIIVSGFLVALLFQGIFVSALSIALELNYGTLIIIFGSTITVTALAGFIQALRWMWEPFLARTIGAWTDQSSGRVPIYIFSLLFAAISFALLALKINIITWSFVCILVMLAATAVTTVNDALASDMAKSTSIISFVTLYSIVLDLGSALGPMVALTIISVKFGIPILFISSAAILIILAILWTSVYLQDKRLKTVLDN